MKGTTDEDGKYRITNVPAGVLSGRPDRSGVCLLRLPVDSGSEGKDLLIAEGEVVEGFDFVLVRGGVITGKVTDAEGRPVVEEFVHLEMEDQSSPDRQLVRREFRLTIAAFIEPSECRPGNTECQPDIGDDGILGTEGDDQHIVEPFIPAPPIERRRQ